MSFIDRENIIEIMEGLLRKIWNDVLNVSIPNPIPHMQYDEAMSKYGGTVIKTSLSKEGEQELQDALHGQSSS